MKGKTEKKIIKIRRRKQLNEREIIELNDLNSFRLLI